MVAFAVFLCSPFVEVVALMVSSGFNQRQTVT
jgi:hypothetical protein